MDNRQRGRRNDRPGQPVEEKQFDERVLHVNRVARVVKGGRRFRFQALVVAGDHKGKVGIGIAKGADVSAAVSKATDVAKKNMQVVPLNKGTIDLDVQAKVGGSKILLIPAAACTGLIAGGVTRIILEVTGIENILSKSLGASNKINTSYAVLEALAQLKPRSEWITQPSSRSAKAVPQGASK